jgi:hypothetical protein
VDEVAAEVDVLHMLPTIVEGLCPVEVHIEVDIEDEEGVSPRTRDWWFYVGQLLSYSFFNTYYCASFVRNKKRGAA